MWTCKKCGKPVYFAERIQSLGFDWHSPCLVCSECGKKLHPGQHAEHAAEPYCHHPCYGALFGPRVFGHGTRNECHRAFGKRNKEADADRALLDAKLKEFNAVHEGKPSEIRRREVNGRPVLEGVLRIHWGVECLIHLKQEDPGGGGGGAVVRSGSRSSVTSGPASDDSDEEPLWRDESPPSSTPSTPSSLSAPSTPATPNPNWPPTPYPTLRPSAPHGGVGPQASPVLSYTHNASPSPVVHPLTSVDVLQFSNGNSYGNSGNINGLADNGNDNPRNGDDFSYNDNDISGNGNDCSKNLCNGAGPEVDTRTLVWSQPEPEGGFSCPDSRYATMKTRTVRKNRDPTHTQSMRDSLLVVVPGGGDPLGGEEAQGEDVGAKDNNLTAANKDNLMCVSSQENSNDNKENNKDNKENSNDNKENSNDSKENSSNDNKDSMGGNCSKGGREDGKKGGVVKRVSFSQVDWGEKLRGVERREKEETISLDSQGEMKFFAGEEKEEEETNVSKEENGDNKKPPALEKEDQTTNSPATEKRPKGKALLRRRPGRRMDKRKVKRRCSINGHLYLRETSSFHLSSDCPPAVVRVSSITTTSHIITTILEKYKIEMSSSNFALCVVKETGEQRRLGDTETPLVLRVLMGPHDDVARLVLCDAAVSSDVSPEMAEFLHLSLAECRAILRQYELEERQQVRAIRAKYDEVKFYCQYWLEQMGGPGPPGGGA